VARLFRFLEKKRGQRRTGSNLVGSVGEAVFCGTLFVLGVLALTTLVALQVANYDPQSLAIGVGWWLIVLAMSSFVVIGGVGLIRTALRVGASAERRGAMARQAADLDIVNETVPRPKNYPTVPPFDGLTNSPGVELAYRLPPSSTPGWRLLATTIFAWLWTAVAGILAVWTVQGHLARQPDWFLTAFLVPFVAVAVLAMRLWLLQIWIDNGMGLTTIEISDCPLLPGRTYQAAIAQHGHITVKSLALWLVCEEEATFRQGTDIRTEVRRVYEEQLWSHEDFRIEPIEAFQATAALPIPATAMHSFQSAHNSVMWKLVVRGEVANWPPFERGFSIVVYPGEATQRVEVGANVARNALRPQVTAAGATTGANA
jgi:hypothetical protein